MPFLLHRLAIVGLIGCLLALARSAAADTFLLESGGQVEGQWINHDEQPLTQYVVRTKAGVTVSLQPLQVREHVRPLPAEAEYERIAPTFRDTVEEQWTLAQWCGQHRLEALRRRHLERVIELEPNHRQARALLGYAFVGGQWVTKEGHHREEGYELYRGRWRRPQEIELLERKSKRELLEKEWLARLQRWRKLLDTDKAHQASQSIRAIDDPLAVRPLSDMFRRERVRAVKTLYADVLANINSRESVAFLIQASLNDADVEIFYYCLNKLVGLQVPRLADEYIDSLRDSNNERVNRAAAALAQIGDRAAVSPLIDALMTVHQRVLPGKPGMSPDATAATFGSDGSATFSKNEGPQVQIVRVQNPQVLEALRKLSGESGFGFDQQQWRYWYNQEKQAEARRGTSTLSRQE
jgi:PBS lyase HEAT-like repeat-containing protein